MREHVRIGIRKIRRMFKISRLAKRQLKWGTWVKRGEGIV